MGVVYDFDKEEAQSRICDVFRHFALESKGSVNTEKRLLAEYKRGLDQNLIPFFQGEDDLARATERAVAEGMLNKALRNEETMRITRNLIEESRAAYRVENGLQPLEDEARIERASVFPYYRRYEWGFVLPEDRGRDHKGAIDRSKATSFGFRLTLDRTLEKDAEIVVSVRLVVSNGQRSCGKWFVVPTRIQGRTNVVCCVVDFFSEARMREYKYAKDWHAAIKVSSRDGFGWETPLLNLDFEVIEASRTKAGASPNRSSPLSRMRPPTEGEKELLALFAPLDVSFKNYDEAMGRLGAFVGLNGVKNEIETIVKANERQAERSLRLGLSVTQPQRLNLVFSGEHGTGKTEVARLLGGIFFHAGILPSQSVVEVDKAQLVSNRLGQSELQVRAAFRRAMGGVLVVNDIGDFLTGSDSAADQGAVAFNALICCANECGGGLAVVLTGMPADIVKLRDAFDGFGQCFDKVVPFAGFSEEELIEIGEGIAAENVFMLDESAKNALRKAVRSKMSYPGFGNAKEMRGIIESAQRRWCASIKDIKELSDEELCTLSAGDFDALPASNADLSSYFEELGKLEGLEKAKSMIRSFADQIAYCKDQERKGKPVIDFSYHMAFLGNPGTGKTTVARIYGKILKEIGVVPTDTFIEARRCDLVGQYLGHTAIKVQKLCERAYGGVLFVDEAYSLVQRGTDQFGHEAVDELIAQLENHSDKLVVIFAGYTDEMRCFFDSNPGFKSRISQYIPFEDYTKEELWNILAGMLNRDQFKITEDAKREFVRIIGRESDRSKRDGADGRDFGNARAVRNIYRYALMNMMSRVMRGDVEEHEERVIDSVDLQGYEESRLLG